MASEVVCIVEGCGHPIDRGIVRHVAKGEVWSEGCPACQADGYDWPSDHDAEPGIVCPECEGTGVVIFGRTLSDPTYPAHPTHRSARRRLLELGTLDDGDDCPRCNGDGYIPVPEEVEPLSDHICTVCFLSMSEHPDECEFGCWHWPALCCRGCSCRSNESAHSMTPEEKRDA